MYADRDEMKEAGEILLALRQARATIAPAVARPGGTATEAAEASRQVQLRHLGAISYASPQMQQGAYPLLYAYSPYAAYVPQSAGVKRMWNEREQQHVGPAAPLLPTMTAMASMMLPQSMRFVLAQRTNMQHSSLARNSDTVMGRTNSTVHRYLASELSKTLEDKVGYGTITPFRPTDKEYSIVLEGTRTMFLSKNKKSSWRNMYRHFLDFIGVKTRKFPPSWWCVSNKDITSEQREKCMRLLLTVGVETLALLDECGHAALQFHRTVDPEQLGLIGLRVREDPQYTGFWQDEWKTLPSDVQFESAASIWYLATLNRQLSFLGDGVLKFMTFLMVRRCDFFRVHTGKHAQGKIPKRYIMNSNSMSNSYARLMSIQLLDHPTTQTSFAHEVSSGSSSVSTPSSPDYTTNSPPSSPNREERPEPKRTRLEG